jgi:hypothetical protein
MEKRSSIVGGLILILVGVLFLLLQLFPDVAAQLDIGRQWPVLIIGVGGLFLIGAALGTPPLAIPGSIIAGIGGLLYYQNATGNWASWAYAWTLIPGFVGLGTILMGLLGGKRRQSLREGSRMVVISLLLFLIFGAFFNGLGGLGRFWPIVLILAGAWLLLRNTFARQR